MLYNNIVNSDEQRLAKRIIDEQEKNNDTDESFFGTVLEMAESIGITIDQLKNTVKSSLKKLIKNKLNKKIVGIFS